MMKKRLLLLAVLSFLLLSDLFAIREDWMTIGFEYGKSFESSSDSENSTKSTMDSIGITFQGFSFWNGKNIGLFVYDSLQFPQKISSTTNGTTTTIDNIGQYYDWISSLSLIIGPGFRYPIDEQTIFYYGFGIAFSQFVAMYETYVGDPYYSTIGYAVLAYNIGIGGSLGVKFDVSDSFYFTGGCGIICDFKNHTSVSSSFGDSSGWASNYSNLQLKPYFALGYNFYQGESGLGKPKKD
jgi:hypothetical protein